MKLSNKKILELANKGNKKAEAIACLRKLNDKDVKYIDVNKVDFAKVKRLYPYSRERLFEVDDLKEIIKKIKMSHGILKEYKKRDIEITFDYHATGGESFYNNKLHNEIKTDSTSLLLSKNGLFILCDAKTKEVIINRKIQQTNHFCNLKTEIELLFDYDRVSKTFIDMFLDKLI